MKKTVLIAFLLLFHLIIVGQPSILFEQNYGGAGNEDRCTGLTKYLKSGYVLTGKSNSNNGDVTNNHGLDDALIIRVNNQGGIIWCKAYGGFNKEAFVTSVVDTNGNIYSVGYSQGINGQVTVQYGMKDVWVVKTDSLGNIIWQKSYGGSEDEAGYDLLFLDDGSLMVACVSESINGMITDHHGANNRDVWILKLNPMDGSVIWKKSFGGTGDDGLSISTNNISWRSVSIAAQNDSTIMIAALTGSADGDISPSDYLKFDFWLLGIDSDGNINSSNAYGGYGYDLPYVIKRTSDGGFIAAGSSSSIDGDVTGHHGSVSYNDVWVVKTDNNGGLIWQKSIGGTDSESAYDVIQWSDGYYLTGPSSSSNFDCPDNYGNADIFIYYIDTIGNLKWSKNFGTTGYDESYGIIRSYTNSLLIAGSVTTADNDVSNIYSGYDYWLFEYTDISFVNESTSFDGVVDVFPNPCNGVFTVSNKIHNCRIEIINLLGEIIYVSEKLNSANKQIDISNQPKGLYFVRSVDENDRSYTLKLILE